VKYATHDNKEPSSTMIKECRPTLLAEIAAVKPAMIIPLGGVAFQAVMGGGFKISQFIGVLLEQHNANIYPLWSPSYLFRNPNLEEQFVQYLRTLKAHMEGSALITNMSAGEFEIVSSVPQAAEMLAEIAETPNLNFMVIDCETSGQNWMMPDRYIRTLQIHTYTDKPCKTWVLRFYPVPPFETNENGEVSRIMPFTVEQLGLEYPNCVKIDLFMEMFQWFLVNFKPRVMGHNLRYDGEWLLSYGADVRPCSWYDTMLAEHMIDNTSLVGLDEVALKYTNFGRYDGVLNKWKKDNKAAVNDSVGYAFIPEDILFPYGAADVIVPGIVWAAQREAMKPYMTPVYPGYQSLFELEMLTELGIYEMELTGIHVDIARVAELTKIYNEKRALLETAFLTMVMNRGFDHTFNHRSVDQIRNLLFGGFERLPDGREQGGLSLTPITTTKPKGGQQKRWEWVLRQPPEIQKNYKASTGKQTLEILEDHHPVVKALLNLRRVDVICKNFFRDDDEGGITGNIWPDGRLHSRMSQLTDTGRFRSSAPNTQNFGKQSERFLDEIFGKGSRPYPMRSICIVPDDYYFLEFDLKQAELFMMAGLSGDTVLMGMLTTPGKDLHTLTTMDSFSMHRYFEGKEVDENWVTAMAVQDPKGFEKLEEKFIYVSAKGKEMTHKEFKSTIRTAGKSISFGIAYGRGSQAIAQQVLAETGTAIPSDEIQQGIDNWKRKYSMTWNYLSSCQLMAQDPGYVTNAYGRRRYFQKVDDEAVRSSNRREAGNFPIQSSVSDFMRIGLERLRYWREAVEPKLHFNIVNQIHDALLLMVPKVEVEQTKFVVREVIENIDVPLPFGGSMHLQTDIELFSRWGEKVKAK